MAMHVLRVATLAVVLTAGSALAKAPGQGAPLFSTPVEACIIPAARFHSVNEYVLRSILKVESGLNPATAVHWCRALLDQRQSGRLAATSEGGHLGEVRVAVQTPPQRDQPQPSA